jgi:hypothetical protein
MINAVVYPRKSPDRPMVSEGRIECLKAVAPEHDRKVSKIFVDRLTVAKKSRERHAGEDVLRAAIQGGGVQTALPWSIYRVGRSLVEWDGFFEDVSDYRDELYIRLADPLDSFAPAALSAVTEKVGGSIEADEP